jgi:Co/Zn/Cd efflux system component
LKFAASAVKKRSERAVFRKSGTRMSASCCGQTAETHSRDGFRRVLWAVLAINAGMFAVEVVAGLAAGSASLQADALDFLGDAGNYVISLAVVGMALRYRAMAAFAKGVTMGIFGLWVIGVTAWHAWHGTVPQAFTMGAVGTAALLANAISFALLWVFRQGDSNMRSAWICTRNDVLGNLAVLLAALGVFGTGTGWPDIAVAVIMASLALHGAWVVLGQSRTEMRASAPLQPAE